MTMNRVRFSILSFFCLCAGCSCQDASTPAAFTREYAAALQKALPDTQVEIAEDLHLKVTPKGKGEHQLFLDNAYKMFEQNPEEKSAIIKEYITAWLETITESKDEIDPTHIVPVIKDRPWLHEVQQALLERGAKRPIEYVYDDLNAELVVLYAEDSPKNIRYLVPENLSSLKIERENLRALACQNLKAILPKIECRGDSGTYMLTAGGNYEASLLLLDSIWAGKQIEVKGEFVVAIPSRDLLLVTGSEDKEGLLRLREIIKKNFESSSYRLTPKLFVYHEGKWLEFKD